jgi:hypothetical protein
VRGARPRRCSSAAQHGQRTQHRDIGQRIDQEYPAGADRRDQQAGHRRAYHAGGVEGGGVERHRIGQVLLAHQLGDEGLARRRIEGADAAKQKGEQVDLPQLRHARQRQDAQAERQQGHGALCSQQNLTAVVPVGHIAGQRQ